MSTEINFESLQLKVPEIVKMHSYEIQQQIFNYLNEMDEHHRKAYEISVDHLGSSFNIYRSNGFKEWCNLKKA